MPRALDFDEMPGDPREHRDGDINQCVLLANAAYGLAARGAIPFATAQEAERYIVRHIVDQHITSNPEVYGRMVADGSLDKWRQYGAGFNHGESAEAVLQRQKDSLGLVLQTAAAQDLANGHMHPKQYVELMQAMSPDVAQDVRELHGANKQAPTDARQQPIDLDQIGDPLPAYQQPVDALSDEQATNIALHIAARHHGIPLPADERQLERQHAHRTADEAHGSRADSASDWSTNRLEKFFAQREAEHPEHTSTIEPQTPVADAMRATRSVGGSFNE